MNVRIFGVPTMECMYAQTRPRFILSSERVLGNGVRTHVTFKGKIPSTGKILRRRVSNPRRCTKQDSEPNTLPASYPGPKSTVWQQVNRKSPAGKVGCSLWTNTSSQGKRSWWTQKLEKGPAERSVTTPTDQRPHTNVTLVVEIVSPTSVSTAITGCMFLEVVSWRACLNDPQSYVSGSLALLAGPTKLNRSVG